MNIWLIAAIILLVSNLATGGVAYLKGKHGAEMAAKVEMLEDRLAASARANTELVARAQANQKVAQQTAAKEQFAREQLDQMRSKAESLVAEIQSREAAAAATPPPRPEAASACEAPEPGPDRGQFTDAELGELQPFLEGAAGHRRQRALAGAPAPVRRPGAGP